MTDEEVLEQLEREWVEALGSGNAAALAEIWDEEFVFTDPTGKSLTRGECLEHLATGAIALEVAELRTVKAQVFGDTGAVLGYITLRGRGGKTVYDGEYSFVDIYTKRDGRWRAVLSSGDLASQLVS